MIIKRGPGLDALLEFGPLIPHECGTVCVQEKRALALSLSLSLSFSVFGGHWLFERCHSTFPSTMWKPITQQGKRARISNSSCLLPYRMKYGVCIYMFLNLPTYNANLDVGFTNDEPKQIDTNGKHDPCPALQTCYSSTQCRQQCMERWGGRS